MNKPTRIPLFPLNVVLFPGMPLPLHIFEPRYKLMTQRCIQEKLEFGLILALAEGLAKVGCTAAINSVVRTYPDGKMDILTEGRSRFQLTSVIEEQPYYEANVEYLEDRESAANLQEQGKLLELFDNCHWLLHGRAPDPIEAGPGVSIAYRITAALPFELEFRQLLLEQRSETNRQAALLERLKEWLPRLQKLQYARRKGAGNGHSLS